MDVQDRQSEAMLPVRVNSVGFVVLQHKNCTDAQQPEQFNLHSTVKWNFQKSTNSTWVWLVTQEFMLVPVLSMMMHVVCLKYHLMHDE